MSVQTIVDILSRAPNQTVLLVDLLRQTAQEELDRKEKKKLIRKLRKKHGICFTGLEEGDEAKISAVLLSVELKEKSETGLKDYLSGRCEILERVKSQYPEAEQHLSALHQRREVIRVCEEIAIPSASGFDNQLLRSILDYVQSHRGCSYRAVHAALSPPDRLQFDTHFDRLRNQRLLVLLNGKSDSYVAIVRRSEVVAGFPNQHAGLSKAVQQLFREYKCPINRQETFQQLEQFHMPLSAIEKDRLCQLATDKPKASKRKAEPKTKLDSVRKLTNAHLVGQLDWLPDKKPKLQL